MSAASDILSGWRGPLARRIESSRVQAALTALILVNARGHRIARWEGALFLGYYEAYVLYLILAATLYAALPAYSAAMLGFVLPLTAVTLIVLLTRQRALTAEVKP